MELERWYKTSRLVELQDNTIGMNLLECSLVSVKVYLLSGVTNFCNLANDGDSDGAVRYSHKVEML